VRSGSFHKFMPIDDVTPSARYESVMAAYGGDVYVWGGASADKSYLNDMAKMKTWVDVKTDSYGYMTTLKVSGASETSAVIPVNMNTAALIASGVLRSDCGDLKMVDPETHVVLQYWIDPLPGCNNERSTVFVEVPKAPMSVQVFHGSATAADGAVADPKTLFAYWEDFEYSDSPFNNTWSMMENVNEVCTPQQFFPGSEKAFSTSSDIAIHGKRSLKVNTQDETGGSILYDLSSLALK